MNLQKRSWLFVVLLLAILAFLVIFQPIRRIPRAATTEAETVLEYAFPSKLATTDQQRQQLRKEIGDALKARQVELEPTAGVQLVTDMQVKITVVPLTAEEERQYKQAVLEVLSKYGQPIPVQEEGPQAEQKYLARLGPLGLYQPKPMIRLGLDLIGGSQLLLRCLPQATYYYTNSDPFYTDPTTREQLRSALAELFTSQGYSRVEVLFPEDNALAVTIGVHGQSDAEDARKAFPKLFQKRYPKLKESGDPDYFLLTHDTMSQVVSIVENRVNALGVAEATVQPQGSDRVLVQLPGLQDPARAINLIGRLAKLEFRWISPRLFKVTTDPITQEIHFQDIRTGEEVPWPEVYEKSPLKFSGRDLRPVCKVTDDPDTGQTTAVSFEFKPAIKSAFRRFTRAHIGEFLAIVLDGELKSCPVIKSVIPGTGIISGQRSIQEASDLMKVLNAGALPLPIRVEQQSVVSATLGRDSVARSLRAGLYGAAAIFAFMFLIYGACGLVADLALILYVGFVLALFVGFGATLTLPGIAGFILSMGMAVDANVLIFERLKEELRTDKTIRAAIEAGFARAWTAILDSNLTTILAAIVLFGLGTGGVRGFALTLTIGVLSSMFTAITVSRIFINHLARLRPAVESRFFVRGLSGIFARGAKA